MKNEIQTQFFDDYKKCYFNFIEKIKVNENKDFTKKEVECFVKKMMAKIVFIKFIQEKGWVNNGDKNYLSNVFDNSRFKDNFFNEVLRKLFCQINIKQEKNSLPYLNCAFFDEEKFDNYNIIFPSSCFKDFFDLFKKYDFSTDEYHEKNENKITPESLSYVFENLLEDNKDKGTFYTPKEIVQYMCEESLIAYLGDTEANRKLVKKFDVADITEKKALLEKLKDVKICDPAIGSGAFPMGMLNILCRIRMKLESLDDTSENIVRIKKEIIQKNIYGVDIEAGAVDIARLRFWLSIVVDEDKPIPLPNLDYKIMQGNSLLEQYNGVDLSQICNKFMVSESSACQKKKCKKKQTDDEASLLDLFDDTLCTPKIMHDAMEYYFSIQQHNLKEQYKDRINGKVLNCIKSALKRDDITIDWENKPFFLWHTYFWDVFQQKGGFDIVIGNPPYIGEKYHRTLFEPVKKSETMKKYYLGKMDYFYFFFHLTLDMLKLDAVGSFITTNYFPTASGAKKLRTDFKERAELLELCNFGELRLFDKAPGQHNMITLFRKTSSASKSCRLIDIHRKGVFSADIIDGIEQKTLAECVFKSIPQSLLFEGEENYIRISSASGDGDISESIFRKMTTGNKKLGDIAFVRTGIMGGCDNLNKKNIKYADDTSDMKVDDGVFVLDSHNVRDMQNINNLKKYSFLKAFYKNSDIGKYSTSSVPEKYIIFSAPNTPEEEQQVIKQHLTKYRTILEHIREINKENIGLWFLLRRGTNFSEIFECPKIVAPQRSKYNIFGYHEGEWYASADVYYISHAVEGCSLKFLLGLLNSKLYYYWLYHKGKRKGKNLELYQKPVSSIPIASVPKGKQQAIIDLVNEILELKSRDFKIDTGCWEKQIDKLVYSLYGLTDDEIAIVEASFGKHT